MTTPSLARKLLLFTALVSACGGTRPGARPVEPAASVTIEPPAVLLTRAGEGYQFRARLSGEPAPGVRWSSSRPEAVDVAPDGTVTAMAGLGSAQIFAEVDGVKSAGALVVVAQPAPNALLLDDAQIGEMAGGKVTLVGLAAAPEVGAILISREGKSLVGKVAAVSAMGGGFLVQLGGVGFREPFQKLRFEERQSLTLAAPVLPQAGRTLAMTAAPTMTETEFSLGPYTCKASAMNAFQPTVDIAANLSASLDVDTYALVDPGPEEFTRVMVKVTSNVGGNLTGALRLGLTGTGSLACKHVVMERPILLGALGALLAPVVKIEDKFSAELTAALNGFTLGAQGALTISNAAIGFDYDTSRLVTDDQGNFTHFETITSTGSPSFTITPIVVAADSVPVRLKASLKAGGGVTLAVGSPVLGLFGVPDVDVIETFFGPKLDFDLGLAPEQIQDETWSAAYAHTFSLEVKPGEGMKGLKEWIENRWPNAPVAGSSSAGLSLDIPISQSPRLDVAAQAEGRAAVADRSRWKAGDQVRFRIKLNPADLTFIPGVYEPKELIVYRNAGGPLQAAGVDVLVREPVDGGALEQTLTFTADQDGQWADKKYFAFVMPRSVPLVPLELGSINALAIDAGAVVLPRGGSADFSAKFNGAAANVVWQATGGVIDPAGHFTAGQTPGLFQVEARLPGDPFVRDVLRIEVVDGDVPPPPVDDPMPGPGMPGNPPADDVSNGSAFGDPHMKTFDGRAYEFQYVGEFLAVAEEGGGPFTVQVRTVPWRRSAGVSIIKVLAANVDGDRVQIDADTGVLLVNGAPASPTSLPGGGAVVAVDANNHRLRWKDGSELAVHRNEVTFNLDFVARPSRGKKLKGLLGDADGAPANDLRLRDGTAVEANGDLRAYATSWRISQAESLFTYAPGTDTTTFTDLLFPQGAPVTVATLPSDVRERARRTCTAARIRAPLLLEGCILDVAVTGETAFANSAAEAERLALPPCAARPPQPGIPALLQVIGVSRPPDVPRAWLNGAAVGSAFTGAPGAINRVNVQIPRVPGKKNVLVGLARRGTAARPGLDRGFTMELSYRGGDGTERFLVTDGSWKAGQLAGSGTGFTTFLRPEFDDSWWTNVFAFPAGAAPALGMGTAPLLPHAPWIWSYDPATRADKPDPVEEIFFRRIFYVDENGVLVDKPTCRAVE